VGEERVPKLPIVIVLILIGWLALTLHQRHECSMHGGQFSLGIPNQCSYPLGSPFAP